jgi:hypothetical protein
MLESADVGRMGRLVNKNGTYNIRFHNIKENTRLYILNIFDTLMELRLISLFAIYFAGFLVTWLLFA